MGSEAPAPDTTGTPANLGLDAGSQDSDAMGRRIQNYQNDPMQIIQAGFAHADNPDVPLDFETRMAVAEPMLRAIHGVGPAQTA